MKNPKNSVNQWILRYMDENKSTENELFRTEKLFVNNRWIITEKVVVRKKGCDAKVMEKQWCESNGIVHRK